MEEKGPIACTTCARLKLFFPELIQILQSSVELFVVQKEDYLSFSIAIQLDWFIVGARWLMNITACDSSVKFSAFTKHADIELVVILKESYIPR